MYRSLLLFAGIVAITYLEFVYYPGHTYLAGESQTLVAMMERLRAPGFLSRDLVATNPDLTYTIFDEVTLFLNRVSGHDFQWVLAAQQVTFRFAGVLGVLLLSLSAGLKALPALGLTALINAGGVLPGVRLAITDPEPTPFGFAFGLTLLAFGLLAHSKPLLAGLMGGIALAYQPVIAAVFWVAVLGGFVFQRRLRPVLRPTFPIFLIFSLLLANAAQLQPGTGESPLYFQRMSESWIRLQQDRTPELWMSTWSAWSFLFYAVIGLAGFFAIRQIWPNLTVVVRWILLAPMVVGVAGAISTFFGMQVLRWSIAAELQLLRALSLFFVFGLIACTIAGWQAWCKDRRWQAPVWLLPLFAGFILVQLSRSPGTQKSERESVQTIARWAGQNTWGGSMFLFPDAGRSAAPGAFRAWAVRAVYTDWTSRALIKIFPAYSAEWDHRWRETNIDSYSVLRLPALLKLPIEYVVLRRSDALQGIRPEVSTPDFLVYDAYTLQNAGHPLRSLNGS